MDNNKELLKDSLSKEFKSTRQSDKNLYDVIVHDYDSRKKHKECPLNNHSVYLLIEDVSENYANDMENKTYFQCICL